MKKYGEPAMEHLCETKIIPPIGVAVRGDEVGVDDRQREDERCKGLNVQQEGAVDGPAHQHHHGQHKDGNLPQYTRTEVLNNNA